MPHLCIACGRSFPDGSKEMLSGCPDCGGNKFQFHPAGDPPEAPADPPSSGRTVTEAVGSATATVRDLVGGGRDPPPRPAAPGSRDSAVDDSPDREDAAQADARSGMVRPDELPPTPSSSPRDTPQEPQQGSGDAPDPGTEATSAGERPDLAALRAELNDQFESIRIVEPGEYELNLMELYDRQEYIIALQENGRYVIQAAESWTDA